MTVSHVVMGENYVNGGTKYDVSLFTADCGEGDGEDHLIPQRNGKYLKS